MSLSHSWLSCAYLTSHGAFVWLISSQVEKGTECGQIVNFIIYLVEQFVGYFAALCKSRHLDNYHICVQARLRVFMLFLHDLYSTYVTSFKEATGWMQCDVSHHMVPTGYVPAMGPANVLTATVGSGPRHSEVPISLWPWETFHDVEVQKHACCPQGSICHCCFVRQKTLHVVPLFIVCLSFWMCTGVDVIRCTVLGHEV